ncbi:hypothetical protein BDW72DRAFT_174649 [Aspergillus terricola var. indicus]
MQSFPCRRALVSNISPQGVMGAPAPAIGVACLIQCSPHAPYQFRLHHCPYDI